MMMTPFDSPVGTEAERAGTKIWPGGWFDATGYGTSYNATGKWAVHTGADLNLNVPAYNADAHKPCYSPADGRVVVAAQLPVWGKVVVIAHMMEDGTLVWSRRAHLERIDVTRGQVVTRGEQIGTIGNAEGRYAWHLHYDLARIDLGAKPTDWPGDDDLRVRRDYYDPAMFTRAHRGVKGVPSAFVAGVGAGNPQKLTARELEAFRISNLPGIKLLTLADPGEMTDTIAAVRRVRPDAFIMARLFYKADEQHLHRFSAREFVDTVTPGLAAAYAAGVRDFEIHNEPNLMSEGMGWNWREGEAFGMWLLEVLNILKPHYPLARWGYPGLSPQVNCPDFWLRSLAAMRVCDWIGAHAYWQNDGATGWGMTSIDGGYHWTRVRELLPGKSIYLTEVSNNNPAVGYDTKGEQYARYFFMLSHEFGMAGAFAFALSWPGQDMNREAWVVGNAITGIAAAVAKGSNPAMRKITADPRLRIRKSTDKNAAIVGYVLKGALVRLLDQHDGWGLIANPTAGWIDLAWTAAVPTI